jgi:hypothetical protein
MMSCIPANNVWVMRDFPRSPGFSSTRTRRSASSAEMSSADSNTSALTSRNRQGAFGLWLAPD